MFLIFAIITILALTITVQLKKTIDNAKAARQIDIDADYARMRKINSICNQQ